MRYVVRNNFFGLESRPQSQNGVKDNVAAAEGRQEKPSEEARASSTSAEDCNQEYMGTSKAVVVDQYLHTCSEPSKIQEPPSTEEKTAKDCHSLDLTVTDKITSTSDIYDDEIWKSIW